MRDVFLGALLLGASAAFYLTRESTPALPEAARILLVVDHDPDVLPHVLDDSTEFEPSFDYLKEEARKPGYRSTEHGAQTSALVRIDPAPSASFANAPAVPATLVHSAGIQVSEPKAAVARGASSVDASGAADVPQVVIQGDWGGTVLVPDGIQLAKAYTSSVSLSRVEAHPIDGERLRVWTRIKNLTGRRLTTEVGCEFRRSDSTIEHPQFVPAVIPEGGVIDVYFASAKDRVRSYTIMVKGD